MWPLLILACGGKETTTGALSSAAYAPPWATQLLYHEIDQGELDGGVDTAASLNGELMMQPSGQDPTWTLEFREGDSWDEGDALMTWELSTEDGLALTNIDGEALSPPLTLVGTTYEVGTSLDSGEYRTIPDRVDALTTWYGTFADVLEVQVDGPIVGDLRFAEGVGLVQISWGDLAADLAWYE